MKTKHILAIALGLITQDMMAQEPPDKKPLVDMFVLAKITILIHDETGKPVTDAHLHIRFTHTNGAYDDGYNDFHVNTDADGKYMAESECTGAIFIEASKDGYYSSSQEYQPADWSKKHERGENLQPWNPTVPIILKKIGKGAPMYVRTGNRQGKYLPKQSIEYDYDLFEDDWVAPHGKGKITDMTMIAEMDAKNDRHYDASMKLSFPNEHDGWIALNELIGIESQMKYPREAPEKGYRNEPINLNARMRENPSEITLEEGHPTAYLLRIRTKKDAQGNIVSANYVKIVSPSYRDFRDKRKLWNPIIFGGDPESTVGAKANSGCFFAIDYYLNPTPNDRTLEFDRKTNLAPEVDMPPSTFAP